MPQTIPEAQFQHELYCACGRYMKDVVLTFPECRTPKGRINSFIHSKKWGIELLCDRDRLVTHNDWFINGEYSKWIKEGKTDDYIMVDFHSTVPTVKHGKQIITTWKTIIYKDCRFQMFTCCCNR